MKKHSEKIDNIIIRLVLIAIFAILGLFIIMMVILNTADEYAGYSEEDYFASVQRSHLMRDYMDLLYIQGEYTIEEDTATFTNMEQDHGKLIEDVALYNAFYQEEPLTAEELNYEFEIFCQKMIASQTLRMYDEGLLEIEHRLERVNLDIEEYGYHRMVAKQLDNYGTNIYNATDEQWYDASKYAADILYREVLSREVRKQ